jgi:uncharacterized protein (TIGR01244 family)
MKTLLLPALLASLLAACASSRTAMRDAPPEPSTAPAASVDIPGFVAQPDGAYTGGRISDSDIVALQQAGVRQIIDLTPDAETPDFDESAAVRAAGLSYANLPLASPDDLSLANVQAFDALMKSTTRPVLVHCASSNRVGAMAALRAAWIDRRSTEESLEIGRAWGLKSLEPQVRARLDAGPQ